MRKKRTVCYIVRRKSPKILRLKVCDQYLLPPHTPEPCRIIRTCSDCVVEGICKIHGAYVLCGYLTVNIEYISNSSECIQPVYLACCSIPFRRCLNKSLARKFMHKNLCAKVPASVAEIVHCNLILIKAIVKIKRSRSKHKGYFTSEHGNLPATIKPFKLPGCDCASYNNCCPDNCCPNNCCPDNCCEQNCKCDPPPPIHPNNKPNYCYSSPHFTNATPKTHVPHTPVYNNSCYSDQAYYYDWSCK